MQGKKDMEFYCYFSYIGPFWLIGLISDRLNDKRLRFHINQGIVLFGAEISACALAGLLCWLLGLIPVAGVWLGRLVWIAVLVEAFRLSVTGMINVSQGKNTQLPIIGGIRVIDRQPAREYYTARGRSNGSRQKGRYRYEK